MATAKALQHKKVRKILDKNDEIIGKTIDKGQEIAEKALERNRDVWLAGLGAFAKAREESGEVFNKLVESGEKIESNYKNFINENSDSAIKTVSELLDKVPNPSEKVEDVFDSRVAKALKRLGVVPTVNALQSLSDQVENLTSLIEEYVDTTPEEKTVEKKAVKRKPVAKKAVKRAPAKKTAAKKPASKKPAAKKVA
jgi:poly(hydroxyalkanoate) granule-associated protein